MLYAIPFISAIIGYVTNYIAIKMLFYPRKPMNFLLFRVQGIFPKRKTVLARRMARLVADELLSMDQLKEEIDRQATQGQIRVAIEEEVEVYLRDKIASLNPIVKTFINDNRIARLRDKICSEIETFVPKITHQFFNRLDTVNLENMVFDQVASFTSDKLENMMMSVIQKELRFIELAGAILGFIIGLVQVFLLIQWGYAV
ncbi:MAG: membrane protein [Cyclobacteriaceae bacterium]|nr:MAG: membrane protein [Cyclobacteriaceae bacterium]